MKNIILFGPPGSGKGTQADLLMSKNSLNHISTGDVFRRNIKNSTDLGKLASEYMDNGQLVPDKVTVDLLSSELERFPNSKGFIFDGFPRTTVQAEILDQFLSTLNLSISLTIALEVDENLLIDRLISRGKDSGRADDQDRSKIQNRFNEYNNKTSPLINFYKIQNKFFKVNGVGDINDISARIFNTIDNNI